MQSRPFSASEIFILILAVIYYVILLIPGWLVLMRQPAIQPYWDATVGFSNSVFFGAAFGSLAAAFAGTYGAQRLADRNKAKEELLKEIKITNKALMLAFTISNTLLVSKKQYVKPMYLKFVGERVRLFLLRRLHALGQLPPGPAIIFNADALSFPSLSLPIEALRTEVLEQLSIGGRALALVTQLHSSINGLEETNARRNDLIERYKQQGQPLPIEIYFGLPHNGQVVDDYPAFMHALLVQSDDGIYFAKELCVALRKYGLEIANIYRRRFRSGAPKIAEPIFTAATDEGLMPVDANYAEWERGFPERN